MGCDRDSIIVQEYDPNWLEAFASEAAWLREALGARVTRIEHFGSTAVPGLAAKPVIDLVVGVTSLDEAREHAVPLLESHGYSFWRANPRTDRLYFVKGLPPNGPRTHHVHMVAEDSEFWERLRFRDYLRGHPDEARRYEALKRELAARFPEDREAYTDGKAAYIFHVMEKARQNEE